MKKSKALVLTLSAFTAALCTISPVFAVVTCPEGSLNKTASTYAECNVEKTTTGFADSLTNIINWIIGVAGLVAVVVVIIGGVTYMTSNGDPGKVKKGKDTILYGVIGLAICVLAFAIVNFVITGALNS